MAAVHRPHPFRCARTPGGGVPPPAGGKDASRAGVSALLRRGSPFLPLLAVLLALPPGWAPAAEPGERLHEVERAIEEGEEGRKALDLRAQTLKAELTRLQAEMVAAARGLQAKEATVSDLEERLVELDRATDQDMASLEERRERLIEVLAVLERLAMTPPEAWFAFPGDPNDTVRGAILLKAAVPRLKVTATGLRKRLAGLSALRAETERRRVELAAATRSLAADRARLDRLYRKKSELERDVREKARVEAERLAKLAEEAKDLRDLLARLEASRRERGIPPLGGAEGETALPETARALSPGRDAPAPPLRRISVARGTLPFPARGRIARRFAEADEFGAENKGLLLETRAGAQVIAPFDGEIVFAGPFRGYGQLLIIEHGEGYHTLLAGMSRINGVVGQRLLAGEPVGVMGGSAEARPSLYVELRRLGQPINPLPWLAASDDKVSG